MKKKKLKRKLKESQKSEWFHFDIWQDVHDYLLYQFTQKEVKKMKYPTKIDSAKNIIYLIKLHEKKLRKSIK